MYPAFKHMILAHPLPFFLFWLPGALFLANRLNQNWDYIEPQAQLAGVLVFALWGIPTLMALPKVWWHLYQKRKHTDPEERIQKRRTRLKLFFVLSLSGGLALSLRWLSEQTYSAYPDPTLYLSLAAAFIILLLVLKIISRLYSRFRSKAAAKPFAVRWCLPVPRRSPQAAAVGTLPDYCRQLLATGNKKPNVAA